VVHHLTVLGSSSRPYGGEIGIPGVAVAIDPTSCGSAPARRSYSVMIHLVRGLRTLQVLRSYSSRSAIAQVHADQGPADACIMWRNARRSLRAPPLTRSCGCVGVDSGR